MILSVMRNPSICQLAQDVGPARVIWPHIVWALPALTPIRYNLLFERFLNPGTDMPDFDIDFSDEERRPEMIEYVVRKYGADHVAQIVTFGTMAAKAIPGMSGGHGDSLCNGGCSRETPANRTQHHSGSSLIYVLRNCDSVMIRICKSIS